MKRDMALIEIIVMVLFFALAATVIVQVITGAYLESRQSERVSIAAVALQDAAEKGKIGAARGEFAKETVYDYPENGFSVIVKAYRTERTYGDMYDFDLRAVTDAGEEIASLTAAQYVGRRAG